MTPNVSEFLSAIGVSGPLTSSMIATARCFSHPNFKIQVKYIFDKNFQIGMIFNDIALLYVIQKEAYRGQHLNGKQKNCSKTKNLVIIIIVWFEPFYSVQIYTFPINFKDFVVK
jgi:hypothetical protein